MEVFWGALAAAEGFGPLVPCFPLLPCFCIPEASKNPNRRMPVSAPT